MPDVPYKVDLSKSHVRLLNDLSMDSEKDDPVVFVGREDVKDHIRTRLYRKRLVDGADTKSKSVFITGAPGVGKTSLLRDLMNEDLGDTVTPVYMTGDSLNSHIMVIHEFFDAYYPPARSPSQQQWRSRASEARRNLLLDKNVWEVLDGLLEQPERPNLSSS